MKLADFKVLTFDCYGTLIDWESGCTVPCSRCCRSRASAPRARRYWRSSRGTRPRNRRLRRAMLYPQLLAEVHRRLARQWLVRVPEAAHQLFGDSVPQWPAFPDSAEALQYLKRHYKLVILSNVDRASFAASNRRLGVEFDAVCTAQDIGSYKPDPRNFRYVVGGRRRGLATAAATFCTRRRACFTTMPRRRPLGCARAWIDRRHEQRGWGATVPPVGTPDYDFRFNSLIEMAHAHAAEAR